MTCRRGHEEEGSSLVPVSLSTPLSGTEQALMGFITQRAGLETTLCLSDNMWTLHLQVHPSGSFSQGSRLCQAFCGFKIKTITGKIVLQPESPLLKPRQLLSSVGWLCAASQEGGRWAR